MLEIWIHLGAILFVDILNPVLFAFLIYTTGSSKPVLKSSMVLIGHTLSYFFAGIIAAYFLESITHFFATPSALVYGVSMMLGLILLWLAIPSRKPENHVSKKQDIPNQSLTVTRAFFLGAVINFIGLPFAIPYFAAVDQLIIADLSTVKIVINLLAYNLLYALPFASIPILVFIRGKESMPILQLINTYLDKAACVLMPLLLGGLGGFLIVDGILFFYRGAGLF